jgi:hypothetical protein
LSSRQLDRLLAAAAIFALTLLLVGMVFFAPHVGGDKEQGHEHKETTTADGRVIQHGSELWTREGVSKIPGGDILTCRDTRENRAWIICRMKDRQSGDVAICHDNYQDDHFGCIENGVFGRRYDWHQNGYINKGESYRQADWNPKRSVH